MTDLVKRLQRIATLYGYCEGDKISADTAIVAREAAAALEAKDAELKEARETIASLRAALQAKE